MTSFDEVRDRAITHYTQFARENPKAHKFLVLVTRLLGVLFRWSYEISRRYLNNVCLFFCFIMFITLVYFSGFPVVIELLIGFSIFIVATIGVSFLDFKELFYEHQIEEKQLRDARKLLTLGVDTNIDGTAKVAQLPASTNEPQTVEKYKSHQLVIGNTVKFIAQTSGIKLELDQIESIENIDQYLFMLDAKVNGTSQVKQLNKLALQLQNNLALKGLPKVTLNGNKVFIAIHNEWLTKELLEGKPVV